MNTRIYVITEKATGAKRLIEAGNPAQAIRFVANGSYECTPASARAVAEAMAAGAKLEVAKSEPEAVEPAASAT